MHAVVMTWPNERAFYFDKVRRMSWSEFGGPMLADIEHNLPEHFHESLRLAEVYIYGDWGLCWVGIVEQVTKTTLGCSGPMSWYQSSKHATWWAMSETSRWTERTISNRMQQIRFGYAGPQLRFDVASNVWLGQNGGNGAILRKPTGNECRVTFTWARASTSWRGRLYYGSGLTASDGNEIGGWANFTEFAPSGSGTLSGYAEIDVPSGDTLMLYVQYTGTTTTTSATIAAMTITNPIVYNGADWGDGDLVTSPTSQNVMRALLGMRGSLGPYPFVSSSDWEVDTVSATPFPSFAFHEPVHTYEAMREVCEQSGGRLIFKCEGNKYFPSFQPAPSTPAYRIDLRAGTGPEAEDRGWDASRWASNGQALYKPSGMDVYRAEWSASTGDELFLKPSSGKWLTVIVRTTDAVAAQDAANLARDVGRARTFTGQVSTMDVKTMDGARVPVEHLVPGELVLLLQYDGEVVARLLECSVEDGRATLTLDTPLGALDATLASLVSGG